MLGQAIPPLLTGPVVSGRRPARRSFRRLPGRSRTAARGSGSDREAGRSGGRDSPWRCRRPSRSVAGWPVDGAAGRAGPQHLLLDGRSVQYVVVFEQVGQRRADAVRAPVRDAGRPPARRRGRRRPSRPRTDRGTALRKPWPPRPSRRSDPRPSSLPRSPIPMVAMPRSRACSKTWSSLAVRCDSGTLVRCDGVLPVPPTRSTATTAVGSSASSSAAAIAGASDGSIVNGATTADGSPRESSIRS